MQNAPQQSPLLLARVLIAVLALGLLTAGHAGIDSRRLLSLIAAETPAPQLVKDGEQMKAAEKAAAAFIGAQTFWGLGHSMEPLYTSNTAVVVKPVPYDNIKKGMTVVYVKRNGKVAAHSVVDEDRRGYVVQGLNNDEADIESVNESNLIGVIVAAYCTAETHITAAFASGLDASRTRFNKTDLH